MSQTSFRSDPARVTKEMEMSTYSARYYLDMPGWGMDLPLMADPNIRLQGWGANLRNNSLAISSELRGATRPLTRDDVIFKSKVPMSIEPIYANKDPFVEESRASHPAYTYRGMDSQYTRFEEPWLNPQNFDTNRPFTDNISSRILAKDHHVERAMHQPEPFNCWLPNA